MRKSVPFVDFGSVSGEALKRANLSHILFFFFVGIVFFFFFLAVGTLVPDDRS